MLAVAARLQIPLSTGAFGARLYSEIINFCDVDPEQFLDVVHVTLQVARKQRSSDELEQMLAYGESSWRATQTGLQ